MEPNIELAKPRDFGEIISDTFLFIRQNFKGLLKSFFIFCGFFMVAGAVSMSIMQVRMQQLMARFTVGSPMIPTTFDSQSKFLYKLGIISGICACHVWPLPY
jgi:hypothetical protein